MSSAVDILVIFDMALSYAREKLARGLRLVENGSQLLAFNIQQPGRPRQGADKYHRRGGISGKTCCGHFHLLIWAAPLAAATDIFFHPRQCAASTPKNRHEARIHTPIMQGRISDCCRGQGGIFSSCRHHRRPSEMPKLRARRANASAIASCATAHSSCLIA